MHAYKNSAKNFFSNSRKQTRENKTFITTQKQINPAVDEKSDTVGVRRQLWEIIDALVEPSQA